jgi:hypothetical protein
MPATLLPSTLDSTPPAFTDRRNNALESGPTGHERRQFSSSYDQLSPAAAELANAIDQYKLRHRRRFINFEEMLSVFQSLGYHK